MNNFTLHPNQIIERETSYYKNDKKDEMMTILPQSHNSNYVSEKGEIAYVIPKSIGEIQTLSLEFELAVGDAEVKVAADDIIESWSIAYGGNPIDTVYVKDEYKVTAPLCQKTAFYKNGASYLMVDQNDGLTKYTLAANTSKTLSIGRVAKKSIR